MNITKNKLFSFQGYVFHKKKKCSLQHNQQAIYYNRNIPTQYPHFKNDILNPTYMTILILGTEAFVLIYGNKKRNTLTDLQYITYTKLVVRTSNIDPAILPPSERAAWFHSLIVYLQVCEQKALYSSSLNPLYWGWKLEHRRLTPVRSDEVQIKTMYFKEKNYKKYFLSQF